jgi:tripartite-type tricarboxylate transporter receptor subunit TctC
LHKRLGIGAIAAALAISPVTGAQAQSYPTRTIKIVVPATPGGAIDTIARMVGDKLSVSMGQPVVVENRPGAANNLGTDAVAKSPPDGYTLLICASSHATNKHLYKALPYDPVADFEPVVFTHVVPLLLAVNPSVPAKTVPELVAWIKAHSATANYASSGKGSKALAMDDVRAKLTATGIEIQGGPPERFAAYIKAEVEKWGKVTKEAGIQPE